MIGLGVAIDYSLFVVSRFREEIREGATPEALARTVATAGRAILFSGLTVAIGLLGMLFLGLGNLGSMGWAGTLVVALAVVHGLATLPALLAVLGPRVNALRVPFLHPERSGVGPGLWHRLAALLMAHPWRVLVPVVGVLLLLGVPFLHLRVGSGDATSLPAEAESRRGDELLRGEFPGGDTNQIVVVLDAGDGSPLEPGRVAQTFALSRWLAGRPHVSRVDSFVDLDRALDLATYQQIAALPRAARPPQLEAALRFLVGEHIAILIAQTDLRAAGEEARAGNPNRAPAVRRRGARHRPDRVRPRFHRPGPAPRAAGDRARRGGDRAGALLAARLRRAPGEGDRDESPLDHRLLRRAGADLPGRLPVRVARLHPGADPDRDAAHHVLPGVRALDGLRGADAEPRSGRVRAQRRRRPGSGDGPGPHRAAHHRRRRDHGGGVLRLRDGALRHRAGRRARDRDRRGGRRHDHPRAAGAGGDAADGALELVAAELARAFAKLALEFLTDTSEPPGRGA